MSPYEENSSKIKLGKDLKEFGPRIDGGRVLPPFGLSSIPRGGGFLATAAGFVLAGLAFLLGLSPDSHLLSS